MGNNLAPFLAVDGLCLLIAWAVGASKGQAAGGFILGLFLGPLGLLLSFFLKPTVAVQAQREVAVEAEKERLRAEIRAEMAAEQQAAQQPYRTEIGRPPGAE